jgi:hypothetical protein
MPSLEDLQVDFVSLVDRAAVRDPENPDEPMRWLIWKRETPNVKEDEEDMADKAKMKQLEDELAELKRRLATAGDDEDGEDRDKVYAEAQTKAAEIRKSDPALSEAAAIARVFKSDPALAERYRTAPPASPVQDAAPVHKSSPIVAEVEKKAAELRKSDSGLTSDAAAMKQVFQADPALYERYRAEVTGR